MSSEDAASRRAARRSLTIEDSARASLDEADRLAVSSGVSSGALGLCWLMSMYDALRALVQPVTYRAPAPLTEGSSRLWDIAGRLGDAFRHGSLHDGENDAPALGYRGRPLSDPYNPDVWGRLRRPAAPDLDLEDGFGHELRRLLDARDAEAASFDLWWLPASPPGGSRVQAAAIRTARATRPGASFAHQSPGRYAAAGAVERPFAPYEARRGLRADLGLRLLWSTTYLAAVRPPVPPPRRRLTV